MTTIFQTLVPKVVAAGTAPSSRQKDALTSTDQQGARRRTSHKEELTTSATVPPLSTSVHGMEKSINSSMPGIVNVIRMLSTDSQMAVKCQIFHNTLTHNHWFSHNECMSHAPGQRCSIANTSEIMLEGITKVYEIYSTLFVFH